MSDSVVSFYAVRGEDREVQITYVYATEQEGAAPRKCLRLIVPAASLLRYPDGRSFAQGDSVLIRVRVVDAPRYAFEFHPSGLRFDPQNPARLEVKYRWADRDIDGDGLETERDRRLWQSFGFWRQERSAEPWLKITTIRTEELWEAHATLTGFTKYALASN